MSNFNIVEYKWKYWCSYCGGYETKSAVKPTDRAMLVISYPDEGVRHVCPKCFIKVFDTILGEPKFTEFSYDIEEVK